MPPPGPATPGAGRVGGIVEANGELIVAAGLEEGGKIRGGKEAPAVRPAADALSVAEDHGVGLRAVHVEIDLFAGASAAGTVEFFAVPGDGGEGGGGPVEAAAAGGGEGAVDGEVVGEIELLPRGVVEGGLGVEGRLVGKGSAGRGIFLAGSARKSLPVGRIHFLMVSGGGGSGTTGAASGGSTATPAAGVCRPHVVKQAGGGICRIALGEAPVIVDGNALARSCSGWRHGGCPHRLQRLSARGRLSQRYPERKESSESFVPPSANEHAMNMVAGGDALSMAIAGARVKIRMEKHSMLRN